MNAALILSGGSGTRMGEDCPKQFLPIGGVPILCRTVQSFCSHPEIDCIMVVCSADMLDQTRSLLLPFHTKKPLFFASGGKTRQASSKNGLLALSAQCTQPDIVLIHDAARPLIPHSVISRCIAGAKTHGACTHAGYDRRSGCRRLHSLHSRPQHASPDPDAAGLFLFVDFAGASIAFRGRGGYG